MWLDNVSIVIPTFLRPGYCQRAVNGCIDEFAECENIVVCDDDGYTPEMGDHFIRLPFDSGLTTKRNRGVAAVNTEYTLMGCDDFDFGGQGVRAGVERMVYTLDAHPVVDVVVGTYNFKAYEGLFEYVPGEYLKAVSLEDSVPLWSKPHPAYHIELGINYFLARTEVLKEVPWDETIGPIGGEHADWFFEMKQRNKKVVYVPGCSILMQDYVGQEVHPEYLKFRSRAWEGHEKFLKKRGIKRWIGLEGC